MTIPDSEIAARYVAGTPVRQLAKTMRTTERDIWAALTRVAEEQLSDTPLPARQVERNRRITMLRREGLDIPSIACRLHCRVADVNLTLAIAGDPWDDTMASSSDIMATLAERGWTRIAVESGANRARATRAVSHHHRPRPVARRKQRHVTPDTVDRIIRMADRDLTVETIARRTGCTTGVIRHVLTSRNMSHTDRRRARDQRIRRLHSQGWNQRDIARKIGCSQSIVSETLRRQPAGRRPSDREREIIRLRANGFTQRRIAGETHTGRARVARILAVFGDPLARDDRERDRLIRLLHARGWRQRDIARKVGCAQSTVSFTLSAGGDELSPERKP